VKLIADENIEREFIEALRQENFEVLSIWEIKAGIGDDEVLRIAEEENAILLTNDKDFGELVFRRKLVSRGVLLLRLSDLPVAEKIEITVKAIRENESELENAFTVISKNSVRIR
jgi:predicted nuclease of predicted toxin-antitoxin system